MSHLDESPTAETGRLWFRAALNVVERSIRSPVDCRLNCSGQRASCFIIWALFAVLCLSAEVLYLVNVVLGNKVTS